MADCLTSIQPSNHPFTGSLLSIDIPASPRYHRARCGEATEQGGRTLTAEETARACARFADELKAKDILILDLRAITQFTDFFVLCTGASDRQLKAIAERIRVGLRDQGVRPLGEEGDPVSGWMLMDYVDVIVHIFSPQARVFYQLEMLWGDAPKLEWGAKDEGRGTAGQ